MFGFDVCYFIEMVDIITQFCRGYWFSFYSML